MSEHQDAAARAPEWFTMDSAPRDGTVIVGIYDNDSSWEYRVVAWTGREPYPWGDITDPDGNAWVEGRVDYWTLPRPGLPLPPPPYLHEAPAAVIHASDCAINNGPAFDAGFCDCWAEDAARELRNVLDGARAAADTPSTPDRGE